VRGATFAGVAGLPGRGYASGVPVHAALIALLLAGGSAAGERSWRELRTAHFLLQTDLDPRAARALARDLELVRTALLRGVLPAPDGAPGRLRVVAFRSDRDFDAFAPAGADAYYATTGYGEPVIVLPGTLGRTQRAALAHELAHHLARRAFVRQPPWFSEGLAVYAETLGESPPSVGGVPRTRAAIVRPYRGGAGRLLATGAAVTSDVDYAAAWTLFHFLATEHADGLRAYAGRLARGEPPERAWAATFPRWDPAGEGALDDLDALLSRHLRVRRFPVTRLDLPSPPAPEERLLPSGAVLGIRLDLPRHARGREVDPRVFVEEAHAALEDDPGHVAALDALAFMGLVDPAEAGRRATEAHPADPRAWLLLRRSLPPGSPAREAALRRALAADPDSLVALNDLAWELVGRGEHEEALPLARRAVALAPWNPAAADTLACALEARGACAEALEVQARAVDLLEGRIEPDRRGPWLERLARLRAACGPDGGP
jgi:tetratricopeptide (TPR) repeat protein